jgi:nicotinate phosphoribosyltransferase
MRKAKLAEFKAETGIAVADFYEYSMAKANFDENYAGLPAVFDLVVRNLPVTKVVGQFEHKGVTYDELAKRPFLVNAGLEQAVAILTEVKGSKELRNYFADVQGITDPKLLNFAENVEFKGDVYAMPEGEIFFGQEQQLRIHERFEEAQVYESLLLATINPQTNVATTASDIAAVVNDKVVLLEGGSRRATDPLGAILNSRAARVGGFHASSNIAYGILEREKTGGTHGHSYVMLHPSEYAAFKAQAKTFGTNVCFLLDTYGVDAAVDKALRIIEDEKLDNFAFRVDSGNIAEQYFKITKILAEKGYARNQYKMVASDDLNAGKIAELERKGAHYDKFLVGTFLVYPPKPLGGVYKLAAFVDKNGNEIQRGKFSENPRKATLPGVKQIYRVVDANGMFARDIIALEDEDITNYYDSIRNETIETLLTKVIENGTQIYDAPSVVDIAKYAKKRIAQIPEIYKNGTAEYPVIISNGIKNSIAKVRDDVDNEMKLITF